MTKFEKAVFNAAIEKYGVNNQIRKAEEELNELQKELFNWQEGRTTRAHIVEEMADVTIMLDQLKMMFGISEEELKAERTKKVKRLIRRMARLSAANVAEINENSSDDIFIL